MAGRSYAQDAIDGDRSERLIDQVTVIDELCAHRARCFAMPAGDPLRRRAVRHNGPGTGAQCSPERGSACRPTDLTSCRGRARDSKEWAYIARFRWRGVVKDALLLVLLIGFFVWVIAHDSLAWYGYLGEAAFLCLLIVLVVGMVGPPLHRAPAVAVSPAGVVVGGWGLFRARRVMIPWVDVASVRVYEFTEIDSSGETTSVINYSYLHVDRQDGLPVRTRIETVRLDKAALRSAVAAVAPSVLVIDEGYLDRDPLARPSDLTRILDFEFRFVNRLRARRGLSPLRHSRTP